MLGIPHPPEERRTVLEQDGRDRRARRRRQFKRVPQHELNGRGFDGPQSRLRVGQLVSGHKKDVVVTNLLARTQGRIAIYGWHRPNGAPIQPLSTVHGVCYADYSHGIRLVSEMAIQDGTFRPVLDILQDSVLANALSDEGAIDPVLAGGALQVGEASCGRRI